MAELATFEELLRIKKIREQSASNAVTKGKDAVAAAQQSDEGLASAVWAAVGLAERYAATGALTEAYDLVLQITHLTNEETIKRLTLDIARKATGKNDVLAAQAYEFLR